MDIRKWVGDKLRRLRGDKRIGQENLADLAGLSRSHVRRIEAGKQSPRVDELVRLLKVLDSSPAAFFGGIAVSTYSDPSHQSLHNKLQDLLEAIDTPLAAGITVNVNSLHNDLMSTYRSVKRSNATESNRPKKVAR